MVLELLKNVILLIALCWVHGLITRYVDERSPLGKGLSGVLFGGICILGMMAPMTLADGLIFDGRTAVLSMAAFFGGTQVGLIAGAIAGAYRALLGGVGMLPGLLNVLMPVLMGLLYRRLYRRGWVSFNLPSLLLFAIAVQVLQVLNLTLLPAEKFALFIQNAVWVLFVLLVPLTLFLGLLLKDARMQRRDRQALLQSEAQLRAITEAVPDLSLVMDEDGRYLRIKSPKTDLLLDGGQGLLGKRLLDVMPVQQADMFMDFIAHTLDSEQPQTLEYELKTPVGQRMFEARARRMDAKVNGKRAVVFMARDITERVEMEREQRIAAIAFESQQGMIITDAQTRILKVNRAFTDISGYEPQDVIGQPTRMLGSGRQPPEFYQQMWQTLSDMDHWEGEVWNRRKSGETFPEWLSISVVRDKAGLVTNYVASLTDISERKDAEEKIQHLAFYDPLTGLPNRRLLRDRLQQAAALSRRNGHFSALIFLDLDDFKNVNDLYGDQTGDELLCQVAQRLKNTLRELDTVARLGGDEFVIMLEGLEANPEDAGTQVEHIGSKLMLALREPYLVSEHRLFNSASLGVVLFNDEAHSVDELMQRADLSMYSAKSAGKNALSFYDPLMQEMVSQRLQLEHDMRRGLAEGEFVLYLQPQMNHLGELQGAEALVRWLHPQRGLLQPGMFIEIAERSGLIAELDLYILRQGCQLLAYWAGQPAFAGLSLAVNISSRLLYKDDFIAQVQHILAESHANPGQLKLEITESLLLTDKHEAAQRMQAMQALGIRFSIDDFGTGYSSMAYLQQLPLNQLKIDQSFVRELPEISSLAIVRAILALAHSLGLEVIAEGVETQAQWDVLRDNGCQFFQGYLFSQPVAVSAFESKQWHVQPADARTEVPGGTGSIEPYLPMPDGSAL